MLTRDEIMKCEDIFTETVDVPEWGGSVLVKALSGRERDDWEATFVDHSGKKAKVRAENVRARLAVRTIVDANGKRFFSDGDAEMLGEKSAAALERIYAVAARLSGIGAADVRNSQKTQAAARAALLVPFSPRARNVGSPGSTRNRQPRVFRMACVLRS